MKRSSFLIVAGLWMAIQAQADDGSARRYDCLPVEPVVGKYFILATKSAQSDLQLTSGQVQSLATAMLEAPASIPGVAEVRDHAKQSLASAQSGIERNRIRETRNQKIQFLIHSNWSAVIQNVLSINQQQRLNQLWRQARGPHIILEDTNLVASMGFSAAQVTQLNQASDSYDPLLTQLQRRYLTLQLQTVRTRTPTEADQEMNSLFTVIKGMEKDRDFEIGSIFTQEQRQTWNELCGTPLIIDWPLEGFTDVPFKKQN